MVLNLLNQELQVQNNSKILTNNMKKKENNYLSTKKFKETKK